VTLCTVINGVFAAAARRFVSRAGIDFLYCTTQCMLNDASAPNVELRVKTALTSRISVDSVGSLAGV